MGFSHIRDIMSTHLGYDEEDKAAEIVGKVYLEVFFHIETCHYWSPF